jgi:hypothetical protein
MRKKGLSLSPLETRVFAWSQLNKQRIIRTRDLQKVMAISPKQEANLLTKMNKSGLAIKIMRGVYLLPSTLPARTWLPSAYYLLSILMQELKAEYQVTGLAAFNFHKLSSQVPNQFTVYNTKISGRKKISKVSFNFIKVNNNRIGDTEIFKIKDDSGDTNVFISSLTRTIVDAIYDYERFATIPEAYDWIRERIRDEKFLKKLVKGTINYGNISTQRRIGYLLDSLGINFRIISPILRCLNQTNSLIPMIPGLPIKGENNRKWGVIINGEI